MDLDPTFLTWIFLVGGLLMLLLEVFVPGGVALFLGLGGVVVATLRFVGLLADPLTALVAWAMLSAGLTIALRPIALRYFGGSASIGITDEDAETMGQTVVVVEPVRESTPGRVRFRGANWDARTLEGSLPKGAEARIVYRDNLTWVVEPVDHSDLDQELAEALADEEAGDVADASVMPELTPDDLRPDDAEPSEPGASDSGASRSRDRSSS